MSVENMRALTGIRLAEDGSAGELRVEITSQDHAYTRSLPKKFAYGTDVNVENIDPRDPTLLRDLSGFRIAPRFWSDDPGAKTCRIGPSVLKNDINIAGKNFVRMMDGNWRMDGESIQDLSVDEWHGILGALRDD